VKKFYKIVFIMCQIGYCLSCSKSHAVIYGSDVKPSPTSGVLSAPELDAETARNGSESGVLSAPEFDAETARNGSDQKPPNLICAYITDVYNNTDFYDFDEHDLYWAKTNFVETALLLFFMSEESLQVNIDVELPFLNCVTSPDGRLKIYFWHEKSRGLQEQINAVFQYTTASGEIRAVLPKDIRTYREWRESETYVPIHFRNIFLLNDNVYICYGGEDDSVSRDHISKYTAVTIKGNDLVYYPAFNGSMLLTIYNAFYSTFAEQNTKAIISFSDNFDTPPYKITVRYAEFIDGKRWSTGYVGEDNYITKQIEFIFNGIEFIGDYDFFWE
jgi:hypothetical protein